MPSNKTRDRLKQEHFELTGKNEMIYRTVAMCPVLDENNDVVYKVFELAFTLDKNLVSMEEIDKCRTQGSALIKLETAFVNKTSNITQIRKVVKELKKEQTNE